MRPEHTAVTAAPRVRADAAPPVFAVALISAAALAYEIVLMRLFSIILWHHFAYMIISLALLGYGASGALLSLAQRAVQQHFAPLFCAAAAAFGVSAIGCFALAQRVPFNPLEILWDPRQIAYLLAIYLLLALPFLCAGACVCMAFARWRGQVARIYSFDILGAGAGSLGVVALLFVLAPADALKLIGARIAFGPRAGQKVLTVQGATPREAGFKQTLCADINGFSLHAAVRCGADDRQALEQLCRYITRPAPPSIERPGTTGRGDRLRPWFSEPRQSDGSVGVKPRYSPLMCGSTGITGTRPATVDHKASNQSLD